ncbi:MAG: DNA-directed RNA polymerase subunit H [Candidatus Altiarchaeota archaeon]|nr:DNA-directed RNA polymerase subunit H [Candidatus Altiarchaeota archaeon]
MIENKLVPNHEMLSPEAAEAVLKKYNVTRLELPKIKSKDPAIMHLNPSKNDVIKITRNNQVTGKSYYYRVVIEG